MTTTSKLVSVLDPHVLSVDGQIGVVGGEFAPR